MSLAEILLVAAMGAADAALVHKSEQAAATTRQAHPDRTDYQARYEADQQKGK